MRYDSCQVGKNHIDFLTILTDKENKMNKRLLQAYWPRHCSCRAVPDDGAESVGGYVPAAEETEVAVPQA